MADSTCLMQSIEPPSIQVQGDSVIRALGESVSFGRFMTETLEWDKWSSFSENRYLEEAKRYAKPGLVAQKKALLEAHFKKTAADRAAAFLEREVKSLSSVVGVEECGFVDENVCESCVDSQSGMGDRCYLADVAQKSAEALAVPILDSQYGDACYNERNEMMEEVSDFDGVNNSDTTFCVQMDQPSCDLGIGTTPDLQPCDIIKFDHKVMVVETSLFQKFDPPDGVEIKLDLSEVVNNSKLRLDDPQLQIAVQDPVDDSVPTSTGNYKPILTCSKRMSSIRNPAVPSCSNLRRPDSPKKELVNTQSTRALGSAFLNKPRVTTKSLHLSINLDSSHQDSTRTLIPSKPGILKISTNPSSLRKSKEFPDKIVTDTIKQKKQVSASNKLPALRNSSAEFHSRPATPQLKKGKTQTVMQRESTLMPNTVDLSKSKPKPLHMPINLDSHVGEKEKLGFLKRTGTKGDSTLIRMSTTNTTSSVHARGKPVISDTATRTKHIIPALNSSTFGRKLKPFHARPIPSPPLPPYKNKNSSVQRRSALTLSQIDMKISLPKSLHLSVDLSSTTKEGRNPALAQNRPASSNMSTIRASRDSSSQGSLKDSARTSNFLQLDDKGSNLTKTRLENTVNGMEDKEKCPPLKIGRPQTPTNLVRPPSPSVSTPFRFRSDERAAKRKEKLEDKYKIESENSLQKKGGKFPSSRPQSPIIRKPSPGKARETTNYKPPQTRATWKAGSYQVTDNKIFTASITMLPRKPTFENASPNIKM